MMTNDIVGDVVQVLLKEPGELTNIGFDKRSNFLKVMGVDDMGIWVAHPSYTVVRVNEEEGKPLPVDEMEGGGEKEDS